MVRVIYHPAAVLLSVDAFEAMQEELDEFRLQAAAIERLGNFDRSKTITHEDMVELYRDDQE